MNADDAYNYNYNNWCYNNSYGYVADQFVDLRNKENMFQLVNVEKNNVTEKDLVVGNSSMSANNGSYEKMDSRDENGFGAPKVKIPFHIASIPKPQLVYGIKVDNTNRPFMSQDGSRPIHPLEEYRFFHFIDKSVSNFEPVRPSPVGNNTFTLVQDKKGLMDLAAKLCNVNEFAVDLEHNAYRSYQGLTCLMQISTRTEDFIVDTLKLHADIGPYLRDVFQDPQKRKVMHGADKDILWLQRDFSIYVCNMFDTGQASRVLKLKRNSLEHLLEYFCGVRANKEYQTADWRLRPLTNEMLRYASEDTHYLLHIYDLMKRRLLSSSTDPNSPESLLVEVYKHSYDVCMQLYEKELTNKNSYLNIYGLHAADLNGQELAVVSKLFQWRDIVARDNDESTGYVLPNKNLIEIAKKMPSTIEELCGVLKNRHPLIDKHLWTVTNIIQKAKQNANAFEEVAATLKRERLEMEQAPRDATKTSEEASTSVDSSNGQQKKEPLNIIFGTFKQKSMADLEKRKAADSRDAEDGSQERNKDVYAANVSSSFQNGLKISNEVNLEKQTGGGTNGYARDCKYVAWERKWALEIGGRSQVFPNSASQMTNRVMNRVRG
ncbi:ribonuclease D, Exosome-associated factor Rrp6 [Artemisia annua]|uniref:Ribonuclease D, Exosome-associated factor Rrp6 n=1 Tax=Artemisia annua TaxID=35608 RepID=A0A2U1Q3Q1_ARTAN|nr:ribonuclease D, Exosome-associated factor Rrp6 [Artemisia annua]